MNSNTKTTISEAHESNHHDNNAITDYNEAIADLERCVNDGICMQCGTELDNFDSDCDCMCHQMV